MRPPRIGFGRVAIGAAWHVVDPSGAAWHVVDPRTLVIEAGCRTVLRHLMLIAMALVGAALALEAGLRVYDVARGQDPDHAVHLRPYRIFGPNYYLTGGPSLRIRSRHGEEFDFLKGERTVRIVTFGGSTTENLPVYEAHGVHYPLLLQRRLETAYPGITFEVINVANSAYATSHSLITFALDVLSWDADIIVVSHNANDLSAAYIADFVPDYSNKYGQDYYLPGFEDFVLKHSRLYSTIVARLKRAGFYKYKMRYADYDDEPPQAARRVFERNLRSFVTLAQANDIDLVLGTQARNSAREVVETHLQYREPNKFIVHPDYATSVKHHEYYNSIIRRVAATSPGVVIVDNQELLGGAPQYFIDALHYTKLGVEKIAQNYAEAIIAAGLIRSTPGSLGTVQLGTTVGPKAGARAPHARRSGRRARLRSGAVPGGPPRPIHWKAARRRL